LRVVMNSAMHHKQPHDIFESYAFIEPMKVGFRIHSNLAECFSFGHFLVQLAELYNTWLRWRLNVSMHSRIITLLC